ncbi:MAG: class I SAM-dependent methyltransferase, partial [Candidatus Heimdallarchaeota archaeon]|nr:class I SAM-dependent methyltransferase [Candidatus Heimdallarchaeota archaeon]
FNHKYIIIPEVLRLLNVKKGEKILDVACGEGTVTRHLAKKGAKLTGIDFSNMIDYGMETENKEKLGIKYIKGDALKLTEVFEKDSFDKIVCNMAVMDISNHSKLFQQISYLLKEDGIFVFSITHPCFAVPTCTSIRVPSDSQRNEDRIRIVKNYFENRPTLVKWPPLPRDMLYFPRTIGEYINGLFKEGLYVVEVSEPQAKEDLVRKFPRNTYKDMDRVSYFLIIKTKKISRR